MQVRHVLFYWETKFRRENIVRIFKYMVTCGELFPSCEMVVVNACVDDNIISIWLLQAHGECIAVEREGNV